MFLPAIVGYNQCSD